MHCVGKRESRSGGLTIFDVTFDPRKVTRRDCLRLGGLAVGGLTLSNLFRASACAATPSVAPPNAVIMVYLPGGPSHIDMYDLKPDAPSEYRGEFKPIRTNVPGMDICELMPRQAKLAHLFSIVRGLQTHGNHDPTELLTGIPAEASGKIGSVRRPAFGSVVSKLRNEVGPIPPYISTSNHKLLTSYDDPEEPAYLGPAHRPFSAIGEVVKDAALLPGIPVQRFDDRRKLLTSFDRLPQELERAGAFGGNDAYTARALEMITSTKIRDALDLDRESPQAKDRYGPQGLDFLRARRLVEAGVSVVSVAARFSVKVPGINDPGGWDTHAHNFKLLRAKLPIYDLAVAALLTDLNDRGMLERTAVVIWGEFGRQPKIGDVTPDGRGHWGQAGFAFLAGGGLKGGQVVGETDSRGEKARFKPIHTSQVLATLYHTLDIAPGKVTFPDYGGRPQFLLDQPEPIRALVG